MAKEEFEYKRNGTTTLTAGLDVVSGMIVSPTLGPTRTEPEFVEHIARTVETGVRKEVEWIFVVDCLNTHMSESLANWTAEQCGLTAELGVKGKEGILKSMATRKGFLSDPSHRICFVYLLQHQSWLNQIEIVFGTFKVLLSRTGSTCVVRV